MTGKFYQILQPNLWDRKVKVAQSCLTLCNSMDSSPPGYPAHGILQARILKWVAIPFSKGFSQPRDQTQVSCIAGRHFYPPPPHTVAQLGIRRFTDLVQKPKGRKQEDFTERRRERKEEKRIVTHSSQACKAGLHLLANLIH